MNERARKLLDEKFGEWFESVEGWWCRLKSPDSSNVVPYSHHGVRCWLSSPSGVRFATADEAKAALDAALLRSVIEPVVGKKYRGWVNQHTMRAARSPWEDSPRRASVWYSGTTDLWRWAAPTTIGGETTEDAAKLAADFALYCEIVDEEKPSRPTVTIKSQELFVEGVKIDTSPGDVIFTGVPGFRWTHGGLDYSEKPKVPASFRARLADEWELRPDGKHVRKATWEGMEFVAIEIVRSQKDGKIATFRCPGQAMRSTVIVPCGWSKKDRRYLSQLWALWSEHHQEVPGADWREVAKARLGAK